MKSFVYLPVLVLLIITSSVATIPYAHAVSITAATSGDWNVSSTWTGGIVPSSADNIIIPSGVTVTIPYGLTVTVASGASITVSPGGTIINSGIIINSGTISNSGTITDNNVTIPTLSFETVNNGAGDQFDPHVSGDLASYTSDLIVRYYNFATHTDAPIPLGSSSEGFLSDISGSKIVFSGITTGVKTAIMVFDASTPAVAPVEIDPASGSNRIMSAIGGNTVAYIDFGLQGNGELVIHDLITNTSVRITNDVAWDQNPAISPDGNVVTWEHCPTSLGNCDILEAVKSGATWNVSTVSATSNPEGNPDSNGTLVVYDSTRGGDSDIFMRPVVGGTESQLSMPGYQANPNIAGNLIAFESRPTIFDNADIFVYDLVTKHIYQITNTPLVNEQLNDITVLPDGTVRVVWASDEDGFETRNVYSATFTLSGPGGIIYLCGGTYSGTGPTGNPIVTHCSTIPTPAQSIAALIALIHSMNLPKGTETSLLAPLLNIDFTNHNSFCGKLSGFITNVNGASLTTAQKAQLIAAANAIQVAIGC